MTPDLYPSSPSFLFDDIALFKLASDATLNDYVRLIRLPELNEEFFNKAAANLQWQPEEGETELKITDEADFKKRLTTQLEKEFEENNKIRTLIQKFENNQDQNQNS